MKALRFPWFGVPLLLLALLFLLYRWYASAKLPEEVMVMVEEFGKIEQQVLQANTPVPKVVVQQEDSLIGLADLN